MPAATDNLMASNLGTMTVAQLSDVGGLRSYGSNTLVLGNFVVPTGTNPENVRVSRVDNANVWNSFGRYSQDGVNTAWTRPANAGRGLDLALTYHRPASAGDRFTIDLTNAEFAFARGANTAATAGLPSTMLNASNIANDISTTTAIAGLAHTFDTEAFRYGTANVGNVVTSGQLNNFVYGFTTGTWERDAFNNIVRDAQGRPIHI